MTEQPRDPAMLSLQQELDAMAREVPDMPESFRQGWRDAVRKDAEESRRARARRTAWRAALNFAAIALFVLGGALLGRESLSLLRVSSQPVLMKAESRQAAQEAPAAGGAPEAGFLPPEAEEAADNAADKMEIMEAADAAYETETQEASDAAFEMEAAEETYGAAVPAAGGALNAFVSGTESAEEASGIGADGEAYDAGVNDEASDAEADEEVSFAEAPEAGEANRKTIGVATSLFAAGPAKEALTASEAAVSDESDASAAEPEAQADAESDPQEAAEPEAKADAEPDPQTDAGASGEAVPGQPRAVRWLLGGVLVGLAVFCWVFLLATRQRAGIEKKRGILLSRGKRKSSEDLP